MHSGGKGISKSSLPYKRTPPSWLKVTPTQVEEHVCKLAKKGLTPSKVSNTVLVIFFFCICFFLLLSLAYMCFLALLSYTFFIGKIGVQLRDSYGIAQVKSVTGNKILRILKKSGLAPEIPEDLYELIKKAVAVRKHLERNKKDKDSKFRLILIESRIHRLARYYRTSRKLDANWKYESATASALVA